MDEKLTLNDGTELTGHMTETETRLFVYVWEKTLAEAFALLNDPEKTERITGDQYGVVSLAVGYTKLMSISEEPGGMICAGLKKT